MTAAKPASPFIRLNINNNNNTDTIYGTNNIFNFTLKATLKFKHKLARAF